MDNNFSIRQFPSPEHSYIAFPHKNLAVLDISRFTFCKVDYLLQTQINIYSKSPEALDHVKRDFVFIDLTAFLISPFIVGGRRSYSYLLFYPLMLSL